MYNLDSHDMSQEPLLPLADEHTTTSAIVWDLYLSTDGIYPIIKINNLPNKGNLEKPSTLL